MKKWFLSALMGLSLASSGGLTAFAHDHCSCDQGDRKDCKCESGECSHGKGCKDGKCSRKKAKKEAAVSAAEKPAETQKAE